MSSATIPSDVYRSNEPPDPALYSFGSEAGTTESSTLILNISTGPYSNSVVLRLFNPPIPSQTSHKIDNAANSRLIKEVRHLSGLENDWGGPGSKAPTNATINDAIRLIKLLPESALPNRAGLSTDGEVSLIWEDDELFADFGVLGDGTFCFFINRKNKKLYGDDIPLSEGIPKEALALLEK